MGSWLDVLVVRPGPLRTAYRVIQAPNELPQPQVCFAFGL
jgi:hypothetical protein